MAPTKRKRLASSVKKEHIPKSQLFLQYLSTTEAKAWLQEIITHYGYSELINHRHITSTLTLDQLKSSAGIGPFDGEKIFQIFL
jgi:hypothetical protein